MHRFRRGASEGAGVVRIKRDQRPRHVRGGFSAQGFGAGEGTCRSAIPTICVRRVDPGRHRAAALADRHAGDARRLRDAPAAYPSYPSRSVQPPRAAPEDRSTGDAEGPISLNPPGAAKLRRGARSRTTTAGPTAPRRRRAAAVGQCARAGRRPTTCRRCLTSAGGDRRSGRVAHATRGVCTPASPPRTTSRLRDRRPAPQPAPLPPLGPHAGRR